VQVHRRRQPQKEGVEGKLLDWRSIEKEQGEWKAKVPVDSWLRWWQHDSPECW
jgi:hypothetical protein